MFPAKPTTEFQDVKFADIKDGLSNTLVVAETCNVDIPWTAPVDLDARTMSFRINAPKRPSISTKHPGGTNVVLGDARTLFMTDRIAPADLRALITIDGGEEIDVDAVIAGKHATHADHGQPSNKSP